MEQTPNNLAAYCWSIADLLRGDFKQSQYGRIIVAFTLLRRLEGVLEDTKVNCLTSCLKGLKQFARFLQSNAKKQANHFSLS